MKDKIQMFLNTGDEVYSDFLEEIKKGHKISNGIRCAFPTIYLPIYNQEDKDNYLEFEEVIDYYDNKVLKLRLKEIFSLLLKFDDLESTFGKKFSERVHSCVSLFYFVDDNEKIFKDVLDKFYNGSTEILTRKVLIYLTINNAKENIRKQNLGIVPERLWNWQMCYFEKLYKTNIHFNDNGINEITGTKFDVEGYDRYGWDNHGFNKLGIYQDLGKLSHPPFLEGRKHDYRGFDINGIHEDTGTKFDKNGWNIDGINKFTGTEYDINGYNFEGYDKDGYNTAGYNKEGNFSLNKVSKNHIIGFDAFPDRGKNRDVWDFLILGKAPGKSSLDAGMYYNTTGNKFRDLRNVDGLRGNKEKQLKFLLDNGIIIWDRVKEFTAKDNSSSDKDRKAIAYNKIISLIDFRKCGKNFDYPTIILLGKNKQTPNKKKGDMEYIDFIQKDKEYTINFDEPIEGYERNSKVTGEDVLKIVYEKGGKVLIQYNDHNAFWLVACAETSNSSPIKFEDKLKDWERSGLNCLKD